MSTMSASPGAWRRGSRPPFGRWRTPSGEQAGARSVDGSPDGEPRSGGGARATPARKSSEGASADVGPPRLRPGTVGPVVPGDRAWLVGILVFAVVTRLLYFLSYKATDPFYQVFL